MPLTARTMAIPGILLLEPELHVDSRGHFFEAWNDDELSTAVGETVRFVQDNQSQSRRGVIRGLHYQLPRPQGKLVRVVSGEAFVVAVDIRRSSEHFGRWISVTITDVNRVQLWLPPGFAHGFMAMCDGTNMIYKVTEHYVPGADRAIRWDDPAIGINWPESGSELLLSDRDLQAPLLAEAKVFE